MRDKGAATMTSKRQDYRTPVVVLDKVREFARLAGHDGIGLDPCSGPGSIVGARVEFDGQPDGLAASWRGRGLVFWNPPYNAISKWAEKAEKEARPRLRLDDDCDPGAESIGLITARTDTRWFHGPLQQADALCFWRGRILFNMPDGKPAPASAPFPSLLPYFGPHPDLFAHVFRDVGMVVRP